MLLVQLLNIRSPDGENPPPPTCTSSRKDNKLHGPAKTKRTTAAARLAAYQPTAFSCRCRTQTSSLQLRRHLTTAAATAASTAAANGTKPTTAPFPRLAQHLVQNSTSSSSMNNHTIIAIIGAPSLPNGDSAVDIAATTAVKSSPSSSLSCHLQDAKTMKSAWAPPPPPPPLSLLLVTNTRRATASGLPVARDLQTPSPPRHMAKHALLGYGGGQQEPRGGIVDVVRGGRSSSSSSSSSSASPPPAPRKRDGGRRTRGRRLQRVLYTRGGSPVAAETLLGRRDDGTNGGGGGDGGGPSVQGCLIGAEEAADVYADVWRRRVSPERRGWNDMEGPELVSAEWEEVRLDVEAEEAAYGRREEADQEGVRAWERRDAERVIELDRRREGRREGGCFWEEWDEERVRERRDGPFWIAERPGHDRGGAREILWMDEDSVPGQRLDDRGWWEWAVWNPETGLGWKEDDDRTDGAPRGGGEDLPSASASSKHHRHHNEWPQRQEYTDVVFHHSDSSEESPLPFAMDSVNPSLASINMKKTRLVSENWEAYDETPPQVFDGREKRKNDKTGGFYPLVPKPGRSELPDMQTQLQFPSDAVPQSSKTAEYFPKAPGSVSQTVVRKSRVSRPRRLTVESTPHQVAARTSKKHFRKTGQDIGFLSPTTRTIKAKELPLAHGFQINLCDEEEVDPFTEVAHGDMRISKKEASQIAQSMLNRSMDEIDKLLTRIWDLYAVGNEQARGRLIKDLQLAVSLQEMMGPNPGRPRSFAYEGGFSAYVPE